MKQFSTLALSLALIAGAPAQADGDDAQSGDETPDLNSMSEKDNAGGSALPDLQLSKLDGGSMNLSDLKGSPVLIHVWATWCVPCQRMMSELQEQSEELDGRVKVVLVSIDTEQAAPGIPIEIERRGIEFDVLRDPERAIRRSLNYQTIPITILFDAEGNQVLRTSGYKEGDTELFLDAIAQ